MTSKITWRREKACGGTTMYAAHMGDRYIAGIQNLDGGWWVWLPPNKFLRHVPYLTLREAKAAVLDHFSK